MNWFSKSGIHLFLPITESLEALEIAMKNSDRVFLPPSLDFVSTLCDKNMSACIKSPTGVLVRHTFANTNADKCLKERRRHQQDRRDPNLW